MSETNDPNAKKLERRALVAGSVISFFATLGLALVDRSSAATVMAAVTVAFVGFYFLPFIDSFEAFGLKAKLRAQITEAEDVLANIRRTALVSAKVLYAQLAWQGRMGTPEWRTKQEWADEMEANLKSLSVTEAEISAARTPHLSFAVYDLFQPFNQVVNERIQKLLKVNREERDKKFPGGIPAGDMEWKRLSDEGEKLSELLHFRKGLHLSDGLRNLSGVIAERVSTLPLPDQEQQALLHYGAPFAAVADAIWKEGKVTHDAIALLEKYSDHREWVKDLERLFPN